MIMYSVPELLDEIKTIYYLGYDEVTRDEINKIIKKSRRRD